MIPRLTTPAVQTAGFFLGLFIILLATLTPADMLPPAPGTDKTHHILGFGGWALLCAFGPLRRFLLLSFIIILIGGAIELIQPYVNRYADWLDFYANACGVLLAIIIRLIMQKFINSK